MLIEKRQMYPQESLIIYNTPKRIVTLSPSSGKFKEVRVQVTTIYLCNEYILCATEI